MRKPLWKRPMLYVQLGAGVLLALQLTQMGYGIGTWQFYVVLGLTWMIAMTFHLTHVD